MMKAIWNGQIIAESDATRNIEGNQYFPPDAVNKEFLEKSTHHSVCLWKGTAAYYHLKVEGKINENAAWYYPETKAAAEPIKGYVAFWRGVEIVED